MNIIERVAAPTPKLFKTLRTIGIVMLAVSGSILTAPIALPVGLVTIAGYLAVAGGVMSAISQITVDNKQMSQTEINPPSKKESTNSQSMLPEKKAL